MGIKTLSFNKNLQLYAILLLSYMLLMIVIIVYFSFVNYNNSTAISVDGTSRYSYRLIEDLNNQINADIEGAIDDSFDIANDSQLLNLLREYKNAPIWNQVEIEADISKIFLQYWKFKPQIQNITIFTEDKNYVSDAHNRLASLDSVADSDWFKELGNKRGILVDSHSMDYLRTIMAKDMATTSLVKIIDRVRVPNSNFDAAGRDENKYNEEKEINTYTSQENVLGVLAVDVSSTYIYEKVKEKGKASVNSDIFVINRQGMLIAGEDRNMTGKVMENNDVFSLIGETKQGNYKRVAINGKDMILVYSPLSKINWRIVQMIPVSDLYIGKDKIIKAIETSAVISILLTLPIALLLARYISNPISMLAKRMREVKNGVVPKIEGSGFYYEVGELYENYNYMTERINDLIQDIQYGNEVLRQTEIKALQAQINPHFLYNTLDSINWMALNHNAPDISVMVTMLSRLFRLSLSKGSNVYTLRNEVEQVRYYMEIQKIRYKDRFEYYFDVEEDVLDYYVPKLILQPLVENSLVHGFEMMTSGGIIHISGHLKENVLYIDLTDNGKGIREEIAQGLITVDSSEGGYGVKNVNERIRYICGSEYGLRYICDGKPGTHVQVNLPLISDAESLKKTTGVGKDA